MTTEANDVMKEYLTALHDEILTIMDEIDIICQNHSLRYYLIGGSLLGAVRHHGFIPWDDDLDIAMPRPDFDKLMEIIKKEGGTKGIYLRWINTEDNYWQLFAKVCRKDTLFQEEALEKVAHSGSL